MKAILFLVMSMIAINVFAEPEYRDNQGMTNEEYQMVREASGEYEYCLNEYAMSQLGKQGDPRVVADHSMKHCAPGLEALYTKLTENDFSPGFSKKFVSGMSNRNANKLLSNLMIYMARQQK
jgi:hypothetical protein